MNYTQSEEVRTIKSTPIENVIVIKPSTEKGKQELAKRVAVQHAIFVKETISNLSCSSEQKKQLFHAVIQSCQ